MDIKKHKIYMSFSPWNFLNTWTNQCIAKQYEYTKLIANVQNIRCKKRKTYDLAIIVRKLSFTCRMYHGISNWYNVQTRMYKLWCTLTANSKNLLNTWIVQYIYINIKLFILTPSDGILCLKIIIILKHSVIFSIVYTESLSCCGYYHFALPETYVYM